MKSFFSIFIILCILLGFYFIAPRALSTVKKVIISKSEFEQQIRKGKEGDILSLNNLFFYYHSYGDNKSSCYIVYKMKNSPQYNSEFKTFYKDVCHEFNISNNSIDMLQVKK